MSQNSVNIYDIDPHIAEVYDQVEVQLDDVTFLRSLLGELGVLRVLEPFCGTGRILIPLALDGHTVGGIDQAQGMLDRATSKISELPEDVRGRITLILADVTTMAWPPDFDLIVLGGNCFCELATPLEQETCIRSAASSLRPTGYVFVDNDQMEGDLESSWQQRGVTKGSPTGLCEDGTWVEGHGEASWWDARRRLIRFRRWTKVVLPSGAVVEREHLQQKHPVSTGEVRKWLEDHGFSIRGVYGDYSRGPDRQVSERAIFWAQRE